MEEPAGREDRESEVREVRQRRKKEIGTDVVAGDLMRQACLEAAACSGGVEVAVDDERR